MGVLVLKHNPQLAYSPAFTFVMAGYVDMLTRDLTPPCLDFGNQSEVVYGTIEDKCVCAQVFSVDKLGRCYTFMAYTASEHRGNGYAVEMFNTIEKILASRLGKALKVIYTSSVEGNNEIASVFAKTGRRQISQRVAKTYNQ